KNSPSSSIWATHSKSTAMQDQGLYVRRTRTAIDGNQWPSELETITGRHVSLDTITPDSPGTARVQTWAQHFDGIFPTGILAVLLASLCARPRMGARRLRTPSCVAGSRRPRTSI